MTTVLHDTVTLTGRSGQQYQFAIWRRETTFQAKGGVFIMARVEGWPRFHIVYIGDVADMSKRPFVRDRIPCFNQHGVDHIFTLEEQDAGKRKAIADDLIQATMPVCNQV
ncbi:MAG: hypothetical protein QM759_13970 [Terricaulis sp.]